MASFYGRRAQLTPRENDKVDAVRFELLRNGLKRLVLHACHERGEVWERVLEHVGNERRFASAWRALDSREVVLDAVDRLRLVLVATVRQLELFERAPALEERRRKG